ncbi:MAG: M14 family zinc carboxypeptidase [Melioribacteraceae bacterium]|nr:M14 family zinc carboxypeptidase [Melioribacteraceae bacterium]
MEINIDYKKILNDYDRYYENSLNTARITYSDILPLINEIKGNNLFRVENAGKSIEGREIFYIALGNGSKKILAWSQMHGDEPTATAALFDTLNFFSQSDEYTFIRNEILEKLQIIFIPMLNPDGAERHQRENKINIDVNRDASRCISPESKLLWQIAEKFKPEFGLNLHDQNSYYTAGRAGNSAAISMLAPPFNFDKSINECRKKSMQVISSIYQTLTQFIPGQIGRYKDDHEPRSFGDTFTGNNISTILIESGFIKNDNDKNYIRKMNFISLLSVFLSIATEDYKKINEMDYFSIPENETLLFDLLLRNLFISENGKEFKVDIGINREKKFNLKNNQFYYKGKIAEIGDLSIHHGIEEYDLPGYHVQPARIFEKELKSIDEIKDYEKMLYNGYGFVKLDPFAIDNDYTECKINIIPSYLKYEPSITVDEYANLSLFWENQMDYIVINGFIEDISEQKKSILNGIVIS